MNQQKEADEIADLQDHVRKIYVLIEENKKKRAEDHTEIMVMLTPLYEAFTFQKQLTTASTRWLVTTTKIAGLILAIAAVCALVWRIFVFAVHNGK